MTFLVGVGGIVLLAGLRYWRPAFPGAVVLVLLSTSAGWGLGLSEAEVQIVGEVPAGLPAPVLPPLMDFEAIWALLPVALTIALVGFMESFAVAKVYAGRDRYDISPNRELIGLGMANLVGAFFRAFPVTGGFSRTAVNAQAGAATMMAGLFSAAIVAVTLLLLTDLFYYLPNAALAAIVWVAVANLLDWREARHLWRTGLRDFAMLVVTFVATLALGIEGGILVGVLASITALVYASSRPHTAVCGRIPGTDIYRNIERNPDAEVLEEVTVFRIDATLSFVNAEFLRVRVRQLVEQASPPYAFVFDFHAVNGIDSTALHQLDQIVHELRERGVEPYFAAVKGPVMDRLRRAGLDQRVGVDRFFLEVAPAVGAARDAIRQPSPDGRRP